jgi:cyclopropane fatty-acyl-phospholipid synthase-like methyltransferase
MKTPPASLASERNKGPILEVLRKEFAGRRQVLEIGSGTGQHAVYFAANLPHLTWQPSDLAENHAAIRAWIAAAGTPNLCAPVELDVARPGAPAIAAPDAVFSANTAHIMSLETVQCMFALVGQLLPQDGIFCLYGPFNFQGRYSSDSNADFDASLRARDRSMGVRDIEELDRYAADAGLARVRLYAMPANNHLAVWLKTAA